MKKGKKGKVIVSWLKLKMNNNTKNEIRRQNYYLSSDSSHRSRTFEIMKLLQW